jgi:hypothetical protein
LATLEQTLADALLSFSPLAALVGAESMRAFSRRVTGYGQIIAGSIAPVGALGLISTIVKGTNLTGLKFMFGVGDAEFIDAALDTGCVSVNSGNMPVVDRSGSISIANSKAGNALSDAATALVHVPWVTAVDCRCPAKCKTMLHDSVRKIARDFTSSEVSGHCLWSFPSKEASEPTISRLRQYLDESSPQMFDDVDMIPNGQGFIRFCWPGPAMPLSSASKDIGVLAYSLFFVCTFAAVSALACLPHLNQPAWQPPFASVFLSAGHVLLILAPVLAHKMIRARVIISQAEVILPSWTQWRMLDRTMSPSTIALRTFRGPQVFTRCSDSAQKVLLSQYHSFLPGFTNALAAIVICLLVVVGFILFYLGGKSSDLRTVVIYIALFVVVGVSKGALVLYSNRPEKLIRGPSGLDKMFLELMPASVKDGESIICHKAIVDLISS